MRIVHCVMHMHWDEVTQVCIVQCIQCTLYIVYCAVWITEWVCAVRWGHTGVHCTFYSAHCRVRVRSEMGSHQFRGSSRDPRLLNRHPLLSDHSDPQDQLDSPDRLQKLHNFTLPMDNQKLPLCNQGLQRISPLMVHKLAFVCIGAGLRSPTTRVPWVFVTMACSVGVLGVFEFQYWRIFAHQLPVPGVSRSIQEYSRGIPSWWCYIN